MKGKIMFYNNREVIVLRDEGNGFMFVCANLDITHEITGSNFCSTCNIGGMASHQCEDANSIIEYIMDEISDHEVFWVHEKYLNEKPFEFKPFKTLVDEITKLENVKSELNREIEDKKDSLKRLDIKLNGEKSTLSDLSEKILFAQKELIKTEETKIEIPVTLTSNQIEISTAEFKQLISDSLLLNQLKQGGVDNWSFYDESIGGLDLESETINSMYTYFKK